MKKIIALPFLFLCVFSAIAQSPQAIPYQAVLRNADGSVIANQAVTITFTIHNNAVDGTTEYQENHSTTSNALGLINLNVGQGTPSVGTFSAINWGSGAKFLQVAMNSGNGNIDLGTQQMLSVPYALYANDTHLRVSNFGDTLYIGNSQLIIPSISENNASLLFTQGNGVSDIDGNYYNTIIIGTQEWMQSNLKVTKYNNGETIGNSFSNNQGAFALYNNQFSSNSIYGKLYNWYAATDSRGLCPSNWHVPSANEWEVLELFLGGSSSAGGALKSETNWNSQNNGATNSSGFNAKPGGMRTMVDSYSSLGSNGIFWSTSESYDDNSLVWVRQLTSSSVSFQGYNAMKNLGLSVRCIKD